LTVTVNGTRTLDLPDSLEAPRLARAFVGNWNQDCGFWADTDDLALLTSEVVTNAVKHAGPPRQLVISRPDGVHVLVEVTDGAGKDPSRATLPSVPPEMSAESGRGLSLLEDLSERWGHGSTERGHSVWFTLPGPGGRRPATESRLLEDLGHAWQDRGAASAPAPAGTG
jgi:anti-sigma regulatory factor (Ser/Thr protein kinase)